MTQFITRAYNSFEVDQSNLSVVVKKSSEKRLLDEINYYEELPSELTPFFPRVFSSDKKQGDYKMYMEYYAYQNVGNKMIHSSFDAEFWNSFFKVVSKYFSVYKKCTKNPSNIIDSEFMFIEKTENEYKSLINKFEFFTNLVKFEKINFNGQEIRPFEVIWPKIKSFIHDNYLNDPTYLIHGDFCFSNILFGLNEINKDVILKFIDPRGSFGKSKNGDIYYDLAKLSHSCSGGYEYFITDNFTLQQDEQNFNLIYNSDNRQDINNIFLKFISENQFDYKKIKLIEGTIFIGMCARHYDSLERQKSMYLTGLKILNDIYETI